MANMLSDTTGRRITGLREREDMTLDELAAKIGINATTLGRIEKGQTQKINSDVLVALAREFSVSTDFLLGLTSIPERKNYDVSELGLSAQSVRNLYTQRVDTDVVNRLLEHPRFATLTAMIAQYLDDTFAAGVAVQNQIFASMSELLVGAGQREAAQAVNLSKVPKAFDPLLLYRLSGHDPAEYPAVSPPDAPRDHAGGLRHLPHHAEGSRGPGGAGRHLLR
jgi:transcriptional regulator with XRE-family HTH domain